MTDANDENRDHIIAENESGRQTAGAIRVSTWTIAVTVLIGLAFFGWVILR